MVSQGREKDKDLEQQASGRMSDEQIYESLVRITLTTERLSRLEKTLMQELASRDGGRPGGDDVMSVLSARQEGRAARGDKEREKEQRKRNN